MLNNGIEERVRELKARAHGRWTEVLRALGVAEKVLSKRNQPCPMCGGTDRFQYTDKYGEGNYYCRGCGAGGGIKLLQGYHGWNFATACQRIEDCVGTVVPLSQARAHEPSSERMKNLAKQIWDQARAVTTGDEVDCYLRNRGLHLSEYPKTLRFHPALGYYEKEASGKSKKVAEYPAMIACIQGADGHAVTLHRTYLKDGYKARVREVKKVLSAGINGGAVRLYEPSDQLSITEGIETGLAIHLGTGQPVWTAISAGNLEKIWVPEQVRRICIYGDNDAGSEYAGQASAFALARQLKKEARKGEPRVVEVFIPKVAGADWADVWMSRGKGEKKVA